MKKNIQNLYQDVSDKELFRLYKTKLRRSPINKSEPLFIEMVRRAIEYSENVDTNGNDEKKDIAR